jgi:hypothetical protein
MRQLIASAIEEHLNVNDSAVQSRRSTRWLQRIEIARFYSHHSRKIMPPLKNKLRL